MRNLCSYPEPVAVENRVAEDAAVYESEGLPNRLLNAREVAKFVGCHEETVRRAYWRGLLRSQRFGVRGRRFHPEDVLAGLRAERQLESRERETKEHKHVKEDVFGGLPVKVLAILRAAIRWGQAQTPPLVDKSPFHRFGVRLNTKAETVLDRRISRVEEKASRQLGNRCCSLRTATRRSAKPGARLDRAKLHQIDLHWHDLRHEGACRLLADGVDIRIIQLMLGHASVQQTQRYLNVTDEELRKGLEVSWKRRTLKAVAGGQNA